VFVPHGTPAAVVHKLNLGLNVALRSPDVSTRFADLNIETRPTTPDEFGAYIADQMTLWSRVVREANIKLG
jgi:tripartite-type tricarboxylate transporter receptor subunit TctC